jgi:predicted nucleotidyltransferase
MIRAMTIAELPIQIDREKIAEFCRARGIRKLSLFGSVLREDFDPASSDVDVLAEFDPDALRGVGFRYFGYGEELSTIIGHKVDLCSRLNKYIEATVRREAVPIYERV